MVLDDEVDNFCETITAKDDENSNEIKRDKMNGTTDEFPSVGGSDHNELLEPATNKVVILFS